MRLTFLVSPKNYYYMKMPTILQELEKLTNDDAATTTTGRREMFTDLTSLFTSFAKKGLPFAAALAAPMALKAQTSGASVTDVLNFALTLEYLERDYYQMALDRNGFLTGDVRTVVAQIAKHEAAHVTFLRNAISGAGGTPVARPTFDFTAGGTFSDVFTNQATFLAVAQAFEDTGVRAYKGQAGNLMGAPDVLTAALAIHSVEARHAAEIRRLRGSKGWITGSNNTTGAPAANAVYAGENNVRHLNVDATTVTTVTRDQLTQSYDEPLTRMAVLDIAGLFIA